MQAQNKRGVFYRIVSKLKLLLHAILGNGGIYLVFAVHEQRILVASRERFASFGYRHTSIAEIACDAGIATGTIYRYFASKEELFRRVVQDLNERWVKLARTVLSEPGPAHERLARLGPASIEFNRSNKLLTSILNRDTEIIHAPLLDDIRRNLIRESVTLMASLKLFEAV